MKKLSLGCTLDCFDACKFNVYMKDGKVIKMEGDPNHPYTKGLICHKGRNQLFRTFHESRITTPLLKKDGKWLPICFEEALNLVAQKLSEAKEIYGPQSVLYHEQYGNGSLLKSIGEIFFNHYGGATFAKGGPCWSAGIAAQQTDFGRALGHPIEDLLHSKTIIVWGKNPAYTSIHLMQMIRKAKANGAYIIVIDPIVTQTAKMADWHIQIKPGSDAALALAMHKMILEEKRYHLDYIAHHVNGFEAFCQNIEPLSLELLATTCNLSLPLIHKLVSYYTDGPTSICLGYGLQKYHNGGEIIRYIDALGALTGQIGLQGGGVTYANQIYPNVLATDPSHSAQYAKPRFFYLGQIVDFLEQSKGITYYKDNIFVNAKADQDGFTTSHTPIEVAIITKSNLLNQLPHLAALKASFEAIPFKVCFDHFMTDTAKACDLFIPTTTSFESEDLLFSSMTNPYLIYNEKILEPAHELMDEYAFFKALAAKLSIKTYPQVDKKIYISQVLAPLKALHPQLSLDYLKDHYFTLQKGIPWADGQFETPSGKFELITSKPQFTPYKHSKKRFRLLTNHSQKTLFSQHMMDETGLSKAYINHKMADLLNLTNHSEVTLTSDVGTVRTELIIDDDIGDDIVMMYIGWWEKHGNPNHLALSQLADLGGQITYHDTFVTISK